MNRPEDAIDRLVVELVECIIAAVDCLDAAEFEFAQRGIHSKTQVCIAKARECCRNALVKLEVQEGRIICRINSQENCWDEREQFRHLPLAYPK